MRVHQMPVQPERLQPQPAPKPADVSRLGSIFEEMAALEENDRLQRDRKPPRREQPRPSPQKARPTEPRKAAPSDTVAALGSARPVVSKVDLLI
jgi:hypothetical protein